LDGWLTERVYDSANESEMADICIGFGISSLKSPKVISVLGLNAIASAFSIAVGFCCAE